MLPLSTCTIGKMNLRFVTRSEESE